ncbi:MULTISPECIES: MBL fold metallo-hydrolase [Methylibium]|uniref:MBL fold metallo-hydrolase n=1 Tax=Methylibium TaxID=316612 RepID=UPI0003F3D3E2|nr:MULTISPECIES: MBL fold metallo-hydrolase [Methylibium]EWS57057.1 Ribonuclease [Methylibium sp. T29]EWS62257.1 Ribonuclease [Methylibium sp. T29-B]MBN9203604.1 MBL fold metallo-hydrolase [Methylibium petroleiphilum]
MQLQFLGATGTVTGSKYLLRHEGATLLVDCGLFQGYKQLRLRNWAPLPVPAAGVDAIVLTHAHIDHSGYVPLLARQGFKGKVYCSEATYELCRILLPDSGHLQEEEAEYANRRGYSKHKPALPLYTREDAERCLKQFVPRPYGTSWSPVPGLQARLDPSGHMLGSAFVKIDDGRRSILFSGDIGRPNDLVLAAPTRVPGADYAVVESTYGDRQHEASDPLLKLGEVINRTAARGGVVVIPAFAVGRAQSLMYCIHLLKERGVIHHLPVYLDSPMATDATRIYHAHRGEHRLSPEQCDAMCHAATIVNKPDDSRALSARRGPMVIISASGMATGGRVVHHLKAFAPDRRNTILFAGYQAGGTRGAAILQGAASVRIHGEEVPIHAEVASLPSLSAHADAAEILQWLRGFDAPPTQTFVTHGEPAAADAMRSRIEHELGWSCRVPDYLETVELS